MRPPTAALALSVLLVLSGCLGVFSAAPSDPGAGAVVEEAVAASETVGSYRLAYRRHVEGSVDGDRRVFQGTTVGVVDRPAERLRMTTTQDGTDRTLCAVGNTSYAECRSPRSG